LCVSVSRPTFAAFADLASPSDLFFFRLAASGSCVSSCVFKSLLERPSVRCVPGFLQVVPLGGAMEEAAWTDLDPSISSSSSMFASTPLPAGIAFMFKFSQNLLRAIVDHSGVGEGRLWWKEIVCSHLYEPHFTSLFRM